ncbi:hypothetical protein FB384_004576 [Prauserella sediminis]|uniref:Cupin domain-containing protein n=1 Tax=Prauserella sediminis TaxID=577680 RepID=A0A839XX11_9PSEU|nr:hypothetical protein [Prauserella sediminis]MBB3665618.1 hypothetical protein [Prauserella sediminis]
MAIFFFDAADDAGWEPLEVDQDDPNAYWASGGFLRDAPVDARATFEKAIAVSTSVAPGFKWRGRRIRAGFAVPTRHQNMRQLRIVTRGSLQVEYTPQDASTPRAEIVEAGGFWTVEAGQPYRMTAGSDGVSYMECWDGDPSLVETYWYDDPAWVRR